MIAFYVAGKGMLKQSSAGSMVIHFLGGIHEIYFPYVLAHPIMLLSVIAGIVQIAVGVAMQHSAKSALAIVLSIASLINGPILGVFLLGMFTRRRGSDLLVRTGGQSLVRRLVSPYGRSSSMTSPDVAAPGRHRADA